MEYDEENGASGSNPEFGAIFMASTTTMKECFRRKVFALPSSCAHFVEQVKAGMVLFLFEFEKRQLFGVYQAYSNGTMDIVPRGFNYSGKRYRAQVCFKPIWHCSPLSEKEFRDAIAENYFSAKKFNFGLNQDQVRRLLYLFSSRKMKNSPSTLVASNEMLRESDDVRTQNQGRVTGSTEFDEDKPVMLSNYKGKSLGRYKELLNDNRINAEDRFYPCSPGLVTDYRDVLTKRRRMGHDVKLTTDEVDENRAYKDYSSVLFTNRVMDSLGMRTNADDRFVQSNRLFEGYDREQLLEPLDKTKHSTSYHRFYLNDCVGTHDVDRPIVYGKNHMNLPAQAMDLSNNYQRSITDKLRDSYDMDQDSSPLHDIEQSGALLHRVSKVPNTERALHHDYRINHYRKLLSEAGRVSENMLDSTRGSSALNKNYGCVAVEGQVVDHMNMGKRDRVEISQDLYPCLNPSISTELPYMSKAKQNLSFSGRVSPEIGNSQLKMSRDIDQSLSNFDDAIITRARPYTSGRDCTTSEAAAQFCTIERKDHSQQGSPVNFYPMSNDRSSSHLLESRISGNYLGLTPECRGHYLANRSNHQTPMPSANSEFLMQREPNICGPVSYKGSSEFSLPSVPYTSRDMVEGGKALSYASKSNEHQFAIDGRHPREPHYRGEHTIQQEMDNFVGQDFISKPKDYHTGYYLRGRYLPTDDHQYFKHSSKEHPGILASNAKRSVFARLSLGPEVQPADYGADTQFDCYDDCVEASADEIMEMLRHSNNMAAKNLRKRKATGKHRDERRHTMHAKVSLNEIEHSTGSKERLEDDHTLSDGNNNMSNETPILDYKRRSDKKKILASAGSDSIVDSKCDAVNEETKSSTTKVLKRRKLVRPVFGKE